VIDYQAMVWGLFNTVYFRRRILLKFSKHTVPLKQKLRCHNNRKIKHSMDSSQSVFPELGLLFVALFQGLIRRDYFKF